MLRFYFRAVFVPAMLVALMLCYVLFSSVHTPEKTIEDEPYGLEGFLFFAHAIYFCLAALPIFLNKYKAVRTNTMLNNLAWLLLPAGLIGALVFEGYINGTIGQGFPYLLFAACDLVYMVGLLLARASFRKVQGRLLVA